jgi:hypothetical protein
LGAWRFAGKNVAHLPGKSQAANEEVNFEATGVDVLTMALDLCLSEPLVSLHTVERVPEYLQTAMPTVIHLLFPSWTLGLVTISAGRLLTPTSLALLRDPVSTGSAAEDYTLAFSSLTGRRASNLACALPTYAWLSWRLPRRCRR